MRRCEDLIIWELDIMICYLYKRVWQLKDGMIPWLLIPWQLSPPRRSCWMISFCFRLDRKSSSGNCCCTPVSCPSTRGSMGEGALTSLLKAMAVRLHWHFRSMSSAWAGTPGTVVAIRSSQGVLSCHDWDGKWLIDFQC